MDSTAGPSGSTHTTPKLTCTKKRLTNLEVSDFIVKHEIHSQQELFARVEARKQEGQCDLANFLLSRSQTFISEIISKTWLLKNSTSEIQNAQVSRMSLIEQCANEECVEGCDGNWLQSATEVLQVNNINPIQFASCLKSLLDKGRGKHRNIILVGPSNCAKTLMFKPRKSIFQSSLFENPSHDKYAWIGAEKAKVILLQDFRYSKEIISWHDLLLLLEGETVKLPAPKNHFIDDIVIDSDVPIFATSKCPIVYKGPFGTSDDRENEMMANRWNVYKFRHVFHEHEERHIIPCKSCFAQLVLLEDL